MMSQGSLEGIPVPFEKTMSDLEMRIMADVVRSIRVNGFSTAKADGQIRRMIQLGESDENIKKWIREALKVTDAELEKIFSDLVYEQYYGYKRIYDTFGVKQVPFSGNIELQALLAAVKAQAKSEFRNITNSLGFAIRNPGTGGIYNSPLTEFYRDTLDGAVMDIVSGSVSYDTALGRAINAMTNSGLRTIYYDTGHSNRVEVAIRRAVMTGFRQVQGKINEQVAKDLGTDYFEVSYHTGARPEHQVWQGRVYSYAQLQSVCGLGSVTGLYGANCYHDYNPFIPGVSVRTYTDRQLEEMMEDENRPKNYLGKKYTSYQALQKQRQMERDMRKTRQDVKLLQEGGADKDSIIIKKARYQGQMQQYKAFSEAMKLPEQMPRVYQDGLGRVSAGGIHMKLSDTTDKWAKAAREELKTDEKYLLRRKNETAIVYNADGKYLFTKRGNEKSISFTRADKEKMKNGIVSHNHPSGGSFSISDWKVFKNAELQELRVVTDNAVYYLRRKENAGGLQISDSELEKEFLKVRKRVKRKYQELYKCGTITLQERFLLSSDEYNRLFADMCGVLYGKEFL